MRRRFGMVTMLAALSPLASGGASAAPAPVTMEEVPSLPKHTVYHPTALAAYGSAHKLPVVVWGNGGCAPRGNAQAPFLTELAAHGYLVIANGPIAAAPPPRPAPPPPVPGAPVVAPGGGGPPPGAPGTANLTTTHQLIEAMDWATAENARSGSPYKGKIDVSKVAAMGTSCGGLQAIEVAGDPRVKTLAVWSSGLLDAPRAGAMASIDDLNKAHGPILYVVGDDKNDGANPHAYKDYQLVNGKQFILAEQAGAVHAEPLVKPNGGDWAPVGIAWLDWQFKGDKAARAMFVGPNGGSLAQMPGWKVQSKGY